MDNANISPNLNYLGSLDYNRTTNSIKTVYTGALSPSLIQNTILPNQIASLQKPTIIANQDRSSYVGQVNMPTGYIGQRETRQQIFESSMRPQFRADRVDIMNQNVNYSNIQTRQNVTEPFERGTSMGMRTMERVQPPMPMEQAKQRIIRTKKQRSNRNKKYVTQPPVEQPRSVERPTGYGGGMNMLDNTYGIVASRSVNDSVDRAIANTLFSTGGASRDMYRDARIERSMGETYAEESKKLKPIKSKRKQKQNRVNPYKTFRNDSEISRDSAYGGIGNLVFSFDEDPFGGRPGFSGRMDFGGRMNMQDVGNRSDVELKPIKRVQKSKRGKKYSTEPSGKIDLDFGMNDGVKASMQDTIKKLIL